MWRGLMQCTYQPYQMYQAYLVYKLYLMYRDVSATACGKLFFAAQQHGSREK